MSRAMIGTVRVAALLISCSGCIVFFPLNESQAPGDGANGDGPKDGGQLVDSDPATCWDLDQMTRDTDGDLIVDGCDNCPLVKNGPKDPDNQSDTDQDGVGQACDPDPVNPIDHLAFFDPMTSVNPATWDTFGGTWTVTTAGVTQSNASGAALLVMKQGFKNPVIDAHVIDIGGTVDNREAGVFSVTTTPGGPSPSDGESCSQVIKTGSMHVMLVKELINNVTAFSTGSTQLPAGSFTIQLRSRQPVVGTPSTFKGATCRGDVPGMGAAATDNQTRTGIPSGRAAFYTTNASATFGPILVIEVDPPN